MAPRQVDADVRLDGERERDFAGLSISTGGDTNGDGYDDLAVFAPGAHGDAGRIYIARGPIASGSLGDQAAWLDGFEYQYLPSCDPGLAGVDDADGDGTDELLVSQCLYGGTGAAFLYLGPLSGSRDETMADHAYMSGIPDDMAGASLSYAGDVDGDGEGDIIIGAWGLYSDETGGPGNAYVLPVLPAD